MRRRKTVKGMKASGKVVCKKQMMDRQNEKSRKNTDTYTSVHTSGASEGNLLEEKSVFFHYEK